MSAPPPGPLAHGDGGARLQPAHLAAAIGALAAALALWNLGHALLWHDEALMALTAKALLAGGLAGWDGRNLFAMNNGNVLDADLTIILPPWPALPSAVGMALLGPTEVGVRVSHTILGLAALPVLWAWLGFDLARQPRLRLLAFAMFALATQVLLFLRVGRYAADAMLFALVLLWAHRAYLATGKGWHLVVAGGAGILGFLNHYFIGAATGLALAVWHVLFCARSTTRRQWLGLGGTGIGVAALAFAWLWLSGSLQAFDHLDYLVTFVDEHSWPVRKARLLWFYFRDLVIFGLVPWPLAVWLGGAAGWLAWRSRPGGPGVDDGHWALARLLVLGVLVVVAVALVVISDTVGHQVADTRYLVTVLPFVAVLGAAVVDWLWRRNRLAGIAAFATLLLTNLAAQPLAYRDLRWTLPAFIAEINRPYVNSAMEVYGTLARLAQPDDLVQVEPWSERAMLQFYLGDQVLLCCMLDDDSHLPRARVEALAPHLYRGAAEPDWHVSFGADEPPAGYRLVFASTTDMFPAAQRPELEYHDFIPKVAAAGQEAWIFQRERPQPAARAVPSCPWPPPPGQATCWPAGHSPPATP